MLIIRLEKFKQYQLIQTIQQPREPFFIIYCNTKDFQVYIEEWYRWTVDFYLTRIFCLNNGVHFFHILEFLQSHTSSGIVDFIVNV